MHDPDSTVEAHLAVWADVMSFLLLGITIVIAGGVDPRRRVWGRSPLRNTLLISFLSINIIYSAGRFIAEGILLEAGPREFLLLSVVYCLRWIWLYVAISRSDSRSAKAFQVAQALRELKIIHLGPSTKKDGDGGKPEKKSSRFVVWKREAKKSQCATNRKRCNQLELVVRRGARVAKGEPYWRGFEERVDYREHKNTFKVLLVEKELHSYALDEIGTTDFRKKIETACPDELYKVFYDLVMTVDRKHRDLEVNYGPFLEETQPTASADTWLARKTQATDPSDLGNVARKVAFSACYYIWHAAEEFEFRTPRHVQLINQCLDNAVSNYFGSENNV